MVLGNDRCRAQTTIDTAGLHLTVYGVCDKVEKSARMELLAPTM